MPPYVPPHLRPGYKPTPVEPVVRRRGVHFKSNTTGLPSHDLRVHRYNKTPARSPTEAEKKAKKYNLSKRKILTKKRKPALKGIKRTLRRTRSNSPKKHTHKRKTIKSA